MHACMYVYEPYPNLPYPIEGTMLGLKKALCIGRYRYRFIIDGAERVNQFASQAVDPRSGQRTELDSTDGVYGMGMYVCMIYIIYMFVCVVYRQAVQHRGGLVRPAQVPSAVQRTGAHANDQPVRGQGSAAYYTYTPSSR